MKRKEKAVDLCIRRDKESEENLYLCELMVSSHVPMCVPHTNIFIFNHPNFSSDMRVMFCKIKMKTSHL